MILLKEVLLQLFFALLPFVMFNIYYRDKTQNYSRKFILVTSTLCLLLSMSLHANLIEGIFFDIRYIIMFFGIVFGGLQTGSILLAEFVMYRLYLGGLGKWDAILIMLFTFPLSILFYKIYKMKNRSSLVTFSSGMVFSIVPMIRLYLHDPNFIQSNTSLNIIIMSLQNSLGIWALISLFNRSVADKEFFISYVQNQQVKAISHVAASLAHEVRNPLTSVKGFLKLIRQNHLDTNKVERYIDISLDEIERTESILSEYLSISKPLSERRERVELLHQLQVVIDIMTPYANMYNVCLEIDKPKVSPFWIMANPDEIKQLLVNLIKNAVEACSDVPDGKVSIRIKHEAGHIQLEIEDNGIGMNEEQIKRLGTIYYSTKANGTGLGLTFSYQVIRALGGMITFRSEPRAGTLLTIRLPLITREIKK